MNKRFPAILLACLVSANAWPADAGASAPATLSVQKAKHSIILDQPYSATHTLTMRRQQPGGGESTRETVTKRYRDSAGRERQDMLDGDGNLVTSFITGTDGSAIVLNHRDKTASTRSTGRLASVHRDRQSAITQPPALRNAAAKPVVEQLGERDIEGLVATGQLTRYQITGGGKTRDVSTESWTAKELGIHLYVKNTDAQGESILVMSNLDRSEPDPALFTAPDYFQRVVSESADKAESIGN